LRNFGYYKTVDAVGRDGYLFTRAAPTTSTSPGTGSTGGMEEVCRRIPTPPNAR
jgi:hypothetical protein